MPIDPKRLSSMAGAVKRPGSSKLVQSTKKFRKRPEPEEDDAEEEFADGEEEETGPEEDESAEDYDAEEAEETPEDEQEEGNVPAQTGPKNPGAAIPALEQYASEIEACCDELDYDILTDPEIELSDQDAAIMQEGVLMLPPRLLKVIDQLTDIDFDAAFTIATHLEEEGMISDAQRVAGWLYRVGQLLGEESDNGEDIPEDEDDLEYDEEGDEGYMGEGDEA